MSDLKKTIFDLEVFDFVTQQIENETVYNEPIINQLEEGIGNLQHENSTIKQENFFLRDLCEKLCLFINKWLQKYHEVELFRQFKDDCQNEV